MSARSKQFQHQLRVGCLASADGSLTLQLSVSDAAHQFAERVEHGQAAVLIVGDHVVAVGRRGHTAGSLHLAWPAAPHTESGTHTTQHSVNRFEPTGNT